jgi:hypothetical protein
MRMTAEEFRKLDLRAHSLLTDIPLHDVWAVDLDGGRRGLTIQEIRAIFPFNDFGNTNVAVRFLFALRARLGRLFRWDRTPRKASQESFVHRLSKSDLEQTLVEPGTREGPFQQLFVSEREAISEIHNATVHAFSVFALKEMPASYRLYWAIYVLPIGSMSQWYMRLIDPFRRFIIYPAVLRHIRATWAERMQ